MKKHLIWFSIFLVSLTLSLSAQTVYITKTGAKYHNGNCRYLSHSKFSIDLKDALDQGYEACKVCRPSQTVVTAKTKNKIEEKAEEKEERSETKKQQSAQCTATTQKGTRCKRMTTSANGKCWQHGG